MPLKLTLSWRIRSRPASWYQMLFSFGMPGRDGMIGLLAISERESPAISTGLIVHVVVGSGYPPTKLAHVLGRKGRVTHVDCPLCVHHECLSECAEHILIRIFGGVLSESGKVGCGITEIVRDHTALRCAAVDFNGVLLLLGGLRLSSDIIGILVICTSHMISVKQGEYKLSDVK